MKLRSLVLALVAVISASAMADPCSEQINFTCFTGRNSKSYSVSVNDLRSSYTGVSEVATSNAIESFKLAWSLYYSNSRNGRGAKDILVTLNSRSDIKINSVGMLNHTVATSAANMIENSSNLDKVKACEDFKAVDPCDAVISSLESALTGMATANPTPTLQTCPAQCKTQTNKTKCDQLYTQALQAKTARDTQLGNQVEDGSIASWEDAFGKVLPNGSPVVDGKDLLAELKNIKSSFKQSKNIGKVTALENLVKDKFEKPCFNAKFTSTQRVKRDALKGLEELKSSYTYSEVETILNNADYYTRIHVATDGGDVIKDHVSICALVWIISAYNKNVGNAYDKRQDLAELLTSKFGEENNGTLLLTGLGDSPISEVLKALDEGTKKIDVTNIDASLIEGQIKKWMNGYKTPSNTKTSEELISWLNEEFVTNSSDIEVDNMSTLISSLINLSSYDESSLDEVISKMFSVFGTKTNDVKAVRDAITKAHNSKTSANIKSLLNTLIFNTEKITKDAIGSDDGITYIVSEVSSDQSTTVNNEVITPNNEQQSNNTFSSDEVSDLIEEKFPVNSGTGEVSVDKANITSLVSSLLKLDSYDETTVDAVVSEILDTFGAKGDYETNKKAIAAALIKAKNSRSKVDIQALIQALVNNTKSISSEDLGGAAGISAIAGQVVGAIDNNGTYKPLQQLKDYMDQDNKKTNGAYVPLQQLRDYMDQDSK